jgi:hypothetical protein
METKRTKGTKKGIMEVNKGLMETLQIQADDASYAARVLVWVPG